MLREFLSQLDFTQILLFVVTAVGSALAVWYRKKFSAWREFWKSVLEGLRSIPDLKNDVKGIRYYVAPNGGGSLMDSVRRTECAVGMLSEQMELVVQTMRAENDADDEVGRFYCSPEGEYTYVNQLYARWLGVGKAELLGWNWLNFVHPEDLKRVRKHWDDCRAELRVYRAQHRMVAATGDVFDVVVVASPIPESAPIKRWIGTIRRTP